MLDWEVFVYRPDSPDVFIARWTTSVFGLDWLRPLVKAEKVVDLGGNGYPRKYTVAAGVLLPLIEAGLPANSSPLVIGEDYVLPAGWSGDVVWNRQELSSCKDDEQLVIEAWDQS
jgi:hypothetical protein